MVAIVYLDNELEEFLVVVFLSKTVEVHQCRCHKGHLHISTDSVGEFKDVELEG